VRVDDGRSYFDEEDLSIDIIDVPLGEIHGTKYLDEADVFAGTTNVVRNGDFSQGDVAFHSDLRYDNSPMYPFLGVGVYSLGVNPAHHWSYGAHFGDNTSGSGKMMIVNGSTLPNHLVWGQTVDVSPNTRYEFSAWATAWSVGSPTPTGPSEAILQVFINGEMVVPETKVLDRLGWWEELSGYWDSEGSTTASVEIRNLQTAYVGNEFVLDDISLWVDKRPDPIALPGWTIYLDGNGNGERDPAEPWTVTDENGRYSFDRLAPGTYIVAEEEQPQWRQTSPEGGSHVIDLGFDEIATEVDFANTWLGDGTVNYAPQFTSTPPLVAYVGQLLKYPASATDLNRDPLTFDLVTKPTGMAVHDTSGLLFWQPTVEQVGDHNVVLRVQDGRGGIDLQPFTIRVRQGNNLPEITSTPTGPAVANLPWEYHIEAQDADDDALVYGLIDGPDGMTVGLLTGLVTWDVPPNGALALDGVNDYVTLPSEVLNGFSDVTAEFWLKTTKTGAQGILSGANSSNDNEFLIYLASSTSLQFYTGEAVGDHVSWDFTSIADDQWHHFAVVRDDANDQVTSYLDGSSLGTRSTPLNALEVNVGGFVIGQEQDTVGGGFEAFQALQGEIDEVRIWTEALTPQQIEASREGNVVGSEPELMAYWRFDELDGDTVLDQTDGGHHGSLGSGVAANQPSRVTASAPFNTLNHVSVSADDGWGGIAVQSFLLPVVSTASNDAPSITSSPRTTIHLGGTYLYQIEASDPNRDPLDYILSTAPDGMSVDDDGLVVWVPTPDQLGPNAVEIRVEDGRLGFAVQGFSVNVSTQASNTPPSIISNPPQSATVGQEYQYDAVAHDPDNDPMSWSLDTAPGGMSIHPNLGTIRWTPTADQIGLQDVVVRVVDAQGGYSTQSYPIMVRSVNVPPNITSAPPTRAAVDELYTYAVRGIDPEDDPLEYSLTTAPGGMTIDRQTGFVEWTPTLAQVGSHDVAILVADDQGGSVTQNYTVVVSETASNEYPYITSTAPNYAPVGELYEYQVLATDPDDDPLQYLLLTTLDGMSIGETSGLIEWTPTLDQVGEYQVIVAAVDPLGAGATQSFPVVVYESNEAPIIDSSPVQVVYAGLPYRYDVLAHDNDDDPIAYSITGPAGMEIDRQLGRVTWSPGIADVATHWIEVTATDDRGLSTTQGYELAVIADNQTPLVNLYISANPAELGTPVTFIVTATDNVGVVSIGLTIDGWPVALNAAGGVTLLAEPAGEYAVVAYATDAAGKTGLASTTLHVLDTSDQQAPDVFIDSPIDGTIVTSPVDVIGTVDDSEDNLLYYRLSAAPVGSNDFVEMFRGETEVVGGALGKFDPSTLANGAYRLRLSATDAGGNTSYIDNLIDVAGDLKIGNFTLSFTDLSIPVSGIPITVTRTYDSLNSGTQNDMGYGWRLEFRDTDLRTSVPSLGEFEEELGYYNPFSEGSRVYVTVPGGRRQAFTFQPKPVSGFGGGFGLFNPAFVPDPGVTSSLSVPEYTLVRNVYGEYFGANSLAYNPADALNFGGVYYLTTEGGLAYRINAKTGDLSVVSDTNGNSLTFTDTAIESSAGPRVTFARDPQGRIISATDPAGNRVRYGYDAHSDLVAVTDAEGNVTQFIYNEPRRVHFLTEVIDPLGRSGVRTEYDDQGRLVTLIDADGNPVGLAHDPDNFIETITDAAGNTTTFEYDIRGNVVTEVDALGGIVRRTYDFANHMLSETDPETGLATTFTYDSWGNLLTETDPLGNVTRSTYTTFVPSAFSAVFRGARPSSWLASSTDSLGNTTTYTRDSAGNLLSTTDAAGNITGYTYDGAGNQTSITDSAGNVTQFQYDAAGNMTLQVDAAGNETTFTYDANGNQLTETTIVTTPAGPRTLVTSTVYDAGGRPRLVTDAEGNTTET
jgi:YD repeat-containing protein